MKLRTLFKSSLMMAAILTLWTIQCAQAAIYRTHIARPATISTYSHVTYIDDPQLNGRPDLIVIATPYYNPFSVYNNANIGV